MSHLICLNAMLEAANRDSLKEHSIGKVLDTHMQKRGETMFRGNRLLLFVTLALTLAPGAAAAGDGKFRVEVELGPVWQSRNDVRIPNETGTEFSLRDIQGFGPFAAGRLTLDYSFNPKHEIRLLYAPLTITSDGELDDPVFFAGESFEAGPVKAIYKFNSYRVTYRYRFYHGDRWTWKIGITGKIRDAKIELRDAATSAADTDLGFVPLVHLDGEYRLADRWKFLVNMDGLAAPQGRAFDVSVKTQYDLSQSWALAAGYRMLEGGADVDRLYTFAWLHYATGSIAFSF